MAATLRALGAVLEAASAEAGRIAGLGLGLQDGMSALLRTGQGGAELQALDALVQQAEGLRSFLSALAGACPDGWCTDAGAAASGLLLDAQRRRLAPDARAPGHALGRCEPADTAPEGVLELF